MLEGDVQQSACGIGGMCKLWISLLCPLIERQLRRFLLVLDTAK
tara:strand:+ start:621 stop:752 length:132 start_codon:yes stop_codon:yes gene_type:complete